MHSYPHTFDNGHGETLTVLRRVPGTHGDRLEIENIVGIGKGPPMHTHHYQDEALTVRSGVSGFSCRAGPSASLAPVKP